MSVNFCKFLDISGNICQYIEIPRVSTYLVPGIIQLLVLRKAGLCCCIFVSSELPRVFAASRIHGRRAGVVQWDSPLQNPPPRFSISEPGIQNTLHGLVVSQARQRNTALQTRWKRMRIC